ncbi:MAG: hypothetical protein ACWGQW_22690, partial [bacterium]
ARSSVIVSHYFTVSTICYSLQLNDPKTLYLFDAIPSIDQLRRWLVDTSGMGCWYARSGNQREAWDQ